MDFDEKQKLAVEISENNFVVNEVKRKKMRRALKKPLGLDLLDMAIIPIMIGVFISLGFLIANLVSFTSDLQAAKELFSEVSRII